MPQRILCSGGRDATVQQLITDVYGDLHSIPAGPQRDAFIVERAVLTPLNADVDTVNEGMTCALSLTNADGTPADRRVYKSADSVRESEQRGVFPAEFLNSLSFSGVPPHAMTLQVGCPVILLRNMAGGLANGTRMIVTKLQAHVIEAAVATGPAAGTRVCLPRLSITPSDVDSMPFTLCRRQFPVRPAFAMTINKSQGQTFKTVGVYLPRSVFTHGQLYVAFSRVGSWDGLKVLVADGWWPGEEEGAAEGVYTKNVVRKEALRL